MGEPNDCRAGMQVSRAGQNPEDIQSAVGQLESCQSRHGAGSAFSSEDGG